LARSTAADEEARRLVELYETPELLQFLAGQLAVVKNQSQLLLGLCGLAITVTGFSGAHMIQSGWVAAASMVAGIGLILIGAVLALSALMRVRWVSQELSDDLQATARRIIDHRDAQQRRLAVAGVFVGLGLAAYLLSVAVSAALHVGGLH